MLHRFSLSDQPEAWQRAIDRALANAPGNVSPLWFEHDQYGIEALYAVASASTEGKSYEVHVVDEADEPVTFSCDCPAGMNGRVCWHVAAVALETNHAHVPQPDPEPVETLKKLDGPSLAAILDGSWRRELIAAAA